LQVATFNCQRAVTALFKLAVTVKPFKQRELHGTVTIRPELKIPNQKVAQK
jgi:hypothetical protein